MGLAIFSTVKHPAQAVRSLLTPSWLLTRFMCMALIVVACTYAALLGYRWSLAKRKDPLIEAEADDEDSELERESVRQGGFVAGGKERQALRRMLGRNASKRASVIRIVSSDPTSSLCDNPMQLELDATGRRIFWPSSPTISNATKEVVMPEKRSSSLSGSPIPTRRHKDTAARLSLPVGGGRSLSASPSPNRSNAPNRPGRPRSLDGHRSKRSFALATDDDWVDNGPLSEENDTLDSAASTPNMARAASEQSGRFADSTADDSDSFVDFSPESSVISLQRLPSILKNQAQTFRTASLRDIDLSHTLMPQSPTSPGTIGPGAAHMFGMIPNPFTQPNTDYGNGVAMAPPPYSPSSFAMDRLNQSWSHARKRQVRLVEPNWNTHADSHIRARERLEAATRFSHFKRSNSVDTHLSRLTDWADGPGVGNDTDPDFWFERFTQSTAAAGRDWDWRKRRARLQRAAAIGAALNQTAFGVPSNMSSPLGNDDNQIKQALPVPDTALGTGQMANLARKMLPVAPLITFNEQEVQSTAPLSIDIETGRMPNSKAAVGYPSSPTPSGSGTPLGGIFGPSETAIRLAEAARVAQRRRRSSEDASRSFSPSVSSTAPVTSSGLSRPPLTSESSSTSSPLRKGMNRVMGRKASASTNLSPSAERPALPKLEAVSVERPAASPSPRDERSSSPSPTSLPPGVDPSDRASSLGSLGRRISRNSPRNGMKRESSPNDFRQDHNGIELVGSSDVPRQDLGEGDEDDEQTGYERSLMQGQPFNPTGFRSSADSYSPPASRLGFRSSPQRNSDPLPKPTTGLSVSTSLPSAYSDSKPAKSSPTTSPLARKDSSSSNKGRRTNEDSLSKRSSIQRSMSKSETDSVGKESSSTSSKKDSLSSTSSPAVIQKRVKSGSRSSIMRSSNSARSEIDHNARRRSSHRSSAVSSSNSTSSLASPPGSRPASVQRMSPTSSMKRLRPEMLDSKHEQAPDPELQPEPAPRGMAHRARSASLSSNSSSTASGSRRSSRSNSIRDGHTSSGFAGMGLAMTSSTPGSPEGSRKTDPFSTTPLAADNTA